MNLERCTECNGKLISNTAMGHTVCSQCGLVNEERQVVSNSGFSEIGASGFFMDSNSSRAKSSSQPFSKFSNSTLDESQKHQLTLQNGNSRISEIATCLKLPTRVAEIAERNFALAVANGFTKGKRVAVVAACCLYIVCRLEKMSFMLMDFSQVLDVFIPNLD